jgi:Fe-S cluster biogenesis protein NfuA
MTLEVVPVVEDSGIALRTRIDAALERVRPAIAADGGDVWLIKVEGPVAYVQMLGACGGCAMSTETLKSAIEASIVAACPEIQRVEAV